MKDFLERCIIENPWVGVVLIVCGTIFGCALICGGVSCVKAKCDYNLKRIEISTPR